MNEYFVTVTIQVNF